jgi:hypothetical protein
MNGLANVRGRFCVMKRIVVFLAAAVIAAPLFAWGEKGHYLVAESATAALPNDMPPFFYQAFPQLVYLAYEPDRVKGGGKSLDAVNEPDHYINYENAEGIELTRDRYDFIAALEKSHVNASSVGFLPWRIAELSEMLTADFRMWRNPRDPRDRELIERNIIYVAGLLAHYAGDSSNPQHTTFNYNGWTASPNPNGYAIDCETHARFEQQFVSHAIVLADLKLAPPVLRTDYFEAALEMVRASNKLVEPLYVIDRDGGFRLFGPVSPAGKSFAAARLSDGGSFLRDLWWSAWRNSATPRRR